MGKLKDKYGGIVVEQKIIVIYLILIVCLISGCGPKVGNENGKGESDNNSKIEMSDNTKSTDFNISYGIEEVKQNDFRLDIISLTLFLNNLLIKNLTILFPRLWNGLLFSVK